MAGFISLQTQLPVGIMGKASSSRGLILNVTPVPLSLRGRWLEI